MREEIRDWLLSYPALRHVSTLVAGAAVNGHFEIRHAIAEAVAGEVRRLSLAGLKLPKRCLQQSTKSRSYHARMARHGARHGRGCHVRLVDGTAVLSGRIAKGVGIWQTRHTATIHIATGVPMTIVAALGGRRVGEVIDIGGMPIQDYRIASAEGGERGLTLRFRVPRITLRRALLDAGAAS